jgi:hypothetical protein
MNLDLSRRLALSGGALLITMLFLAVASRLPCF